MQKINGDFYFSASDLVNFLECQHLSRLDLRSFEETMIKAQDDEQAKLVQAKGLAHEKRYLNQLILQHGTSIIDIANIFPNRADQYQATINAMKKGYSIIYQAAFKSGDFVGYADFLRRIETPSQLGSYSYEVIDTKLSKSARSKYLIQLCLYSEFIAEIQGNLPTYTYVALGSREEEKFRIANYFHYFKSLKNRFLTFIKNSAPTVPTPCDKCEQCHWRDMCNDKWDREDHLSRVANISKQNIIRLENAGIKTLEQLGTHSPNDAIAKISSPVLHRLCEQAALQLQGRQTQTPTYKVIKPPSEAGHSPYGFSRMPKPNSGDMFFDMEGNPMEEDGGLEYLFGLYVFDDGRPKFIPFWAHTRSQEKIAFEQFVDYVTGRLKQYPDAFIYHYAPYETTALKKLMGLHGTREAEIDQLLRTQKFVDLYRVVRESLRISEPSYSIKYLERFYTKARQGSVQNAGASIVYYEKWKFTKDDTILQEIANYNEDDVRSTFELRDWLLNIKMQQNHHDWFESKHPSLSEESPHTNERESRINEITKIKAELINSLPKESSSWDDLQRIRNLVAQLLDFFRRTSKPQWWGLFERQLMAIDEQIENTDCIAGLTPVMGIPPRRELRSTRYTFSYPEQEFKIKSGQHVVIAQTLMNISDLIIDETNKIITFKIGNSKSLPDGKITIGAAGPIDTTKLEEAVKRYAKSIIQSRNIFKSSYKAIDDFLTKSIPTIIGVTQGQPIITGNVNTEKIVDTVLRMNETYLFLQGPPGAGKTYNGSEMILSLIAKGKKIGVTSNSHKAINNLLEAVDSKATSRGIKLTGYKYSSGNEEQCINGQQIKDTNNFNVCVKSDVSLIAGTAWFFAREELDQTLDYIFIDEAGQISLAHLIAVGCSAKNIVLLGDQMQLSQPIQGIHPYDSGKSTLDYLLNGQATIPAEKGVFLDITRRMHSDVCKFISYAVYDSRLINDPQTDLRTLELNQNHHCALKKSGISLISISHDGNTQSSQEEVDEISDIYNDLLNQSYIDLEGKRHPVTTANILVVAPYNLQVNLLKKCLPEGARVGTVDKFQGQEAEVVLISMVTSNEEYLPRDLEFLFSLNRINVAVSRAKCLAVMVCSPELMDTVCKKPEQMALVNTLCWLKEYADSSQ